MVRDITPMQTEPPCVSCTCFILACHMCWSLFRTWFTTGAAALTRCSLGSQSEYRASPTGCHCLPGQTPAFTRPVMSTVQLQYMERALPCPQHRNVSGSSQWETLDNKQYRPPFPAPPTGKFQTFPLKKVLLCVAGENTGLVPAAIWILQPDSS